MLNLIKSATTYRAELPSSEVLREAVMEHLFHDIETHQTRSIGFYRIAETGEVVSDFEGGYAFGFRIDEKVIPSSAVKTQVDKEISDITQTQGYVPGRKQRTEITHMVRDRLAANALARTTVVTAFYVPEKELLIIPTINRKVADLITGRLVRVFGSLKATTLYVREASQGLTNRLAQYLEGNEEAWSRFEPAGKLHLRKSTSNVRIDMDYVDKAAEAIREGLSNAMQVESIQLFGLEVTPEYHVEFVLGRDLRLRGLSYVPLERKEDAPEEDKWYDAAADQTALVTIVVDLLLEMFGKQMTDFTFYSGDEEE